MFTTIKKAIFFDIWHRPNALGHLWTSSSVHLSVCLCKRSNQTTNL